MREYQTQIFEHTLIEKNVNIRNCFNHLDLDTEELY